MKLYHGSNVSIDKIDLSKSKPYKDFGQGFYLSENESQAQDMAIFKSTQLGGDPIVSEFVFDETIMLDSSLRVKVFKGYSEEWADFVLANRDGTVTEHYDTYTALSPTIKLDFKSAN